MPCLALDMRTGPGMSECCGCGNTIDVAAMQAKQHRTLMIVLVINLATLVMMVGAA